ncbi:hypothetical protein OIU77_021008 [Salix suchowensis]|uniref:non-specific serine/threonine protein kinase n=1 Tax=Salix suchowensis TaxID=1278906 RepID=A0ABQ9CB94_9ROSI|nr:hypothetical protein OIU77_021008 [Salix suchowensis]
MSSSAPEQSPLSPPPPPSAPPPSLKELSPPPLESSPPLSSSPPPVEVSSSPPRPKESTPPPDHSSSSPPPENSDSSPPPPSSSKENNSPPPPPTKIDNGSNIWSPPPPPSSSKSRNSPPPPRSLGPSGNSSANNIPATSPSNGDGSNLVPVIAGAVVGAGFLLLLALLYNYYNATPPQQPFTNRHSESKLAEQVVNLPPTPGGGHGAWSPAPPPPQVALMSSGEMSSNYSGPHSSSGLPPSHPTLAHGFTKSSFSYGELAAATSGFAQANLLGQGGFGYVHKGARVIRPWTGLLGSKLPWDLPEDLHTCMKTVADFGLAKLSSDTYTHVSTRIMGTFGYLAPEYASSGKLTDKSDVFSFGVMLLELITGRRPVDLSGDMDDSLVDWARPLCAKALEDGNYGELVDPSLEGNYDLQEVACMVACAGASVSHSAKMRPKMSRIVRALEGEVSLVEGRKAGLIFSSDSSSDYDQSSYSTDMRRFRRKALDSNDYVSSEFGHTSEYGLNPSSSSSDEMSQLTKSRTGSQRRSP